jgi:anti-anti-sigma regulatory factor
MVCAAGVKVMSVPDSEAHWTIAASLRVSTKTLEGTLGSASARGMAGHDGDAVYLPGRRAGAKTSQAEMRAPLEIVPELSRDRGWRRPSEGPNESRDPPDNGPTKENIKGTNCPSVVVLAGERDERRNEVTDDQNDQKHGNLRVAESSVLATTLAAQCVADREEIRVRVLIFRSGHTAPLDIELKCAESRAQDHDESKGDRCLSVLRLPHLMLAANVKGTLDLLAEMVASKDDVVRIDADGLVFAEPLPLCLLAAQLNRLSAQGQSAVIERVRPEVAERLRKMNVLGEWLEEKASARYRAESMNTLQVCWASSLKDADTIANTLADSIVTFVPPEYIEAEDSFTRDPIRMPLAYVITELLDNGLTHGRGKGFSHASVWIAAQWYEHGDLIRLAIVDNGCGFLRSLESHPQVDPKTHQVAVRKAFDPGISCNKEVGLFKDALNMGIGLTISRDITIRSRGTLWAGSGDAWITNPGHATEKSSRIPNWNGSMLNLELHRAGLLSFHFRDLFTQYQRESLGAEINFIF